MHNHFYHKIQKSIIFMPPKIPYSAEQTFFAFYNRKRLLITYNATALRLVKQTQE